MSMLVKLAPPLPFDEQNKADAVKLLQETLSRAEAGEVLGAIIITKDTDGMWSHLTTATLSIREEIGALETLKWDRIYRSHKD